LLLEDGQAGQRHCDHSREHPERDASLPTQQRGHTRGERTAKPNLEVKTRNSTPFAPITRSSQSLSFSPLSCKSRTKVTSISTTRSHVMHACGMQRMQTKVGTYRAPLQLVRHDAVADQACSTSAAHQHEEQKLKETPWGSTCEPGQDAEADRRAAEVRELHTTSSVPH
jgi:hypothetical protein